MCPCLEAGSSQRSSSYNEVMRVSLILTRLLSLQEGGLWTQIGTGRDPCEETQGEDHHLQAREEGRVCSLAHSHEKEPTLLTLGVQTSSLRTVKQQSPVAYTTQPVAFRDGSPRKLIQGVTLLERAMSYGLDCLSLTCGFRRAR